MLYLCILDVLLLFTLSGSFKTACGEERGEEEEKTFWHSTCMLPYWLWGLAEIKTRCTVPSEAAVGDVHAALLMVRSFSESTLLSTKPLACDCRNLYPDSAVIEMQSGNCGLEVVNVHAEHQSGAAQPPVGGRTLYGARSCITAPWSECVGIPTCVKSWWWKGDLCL